MANNIKKTDPKNKAITFGNNGLNLKPGDNSKYLSFALQNIAYPPINLQDSNAVMDRLNCYFNSCVDRDMKPTVAGMANSLNVTRKDLWEIAKGNHRPVAKFSSESADLIKKAYNLLEEMYENYMINGKVNPVAGIFMGKNHFGYQDKQEVVVTPNNPLGDEIDENEIKKRIEADTKNMIDIEE